MCHPIQHDGASLTGDVWIHQRRVHRGSRRHACNQGGLGGRELIGLFAEVNPGGIGDAIGAGSQVHVVEVLLQDLLFAELALELHRQGRFFQLARDGAVLTQKHRASQLLGDGAGPLAHGTFLQVGHQGPRHAPGVDAVVVVEATVFRCDESLLHQERHFSRLHLFPGRRPQLLNHLPVTGQQGDGAWSVEIGDPPSIRQGRVDDLDDSPGSQGCANADGSSGTGNQSPVQAGAVHIT